MRWCVMVPPNDSAGFYTGLNCHGFGHPVAMEQSRTSCKLKGISKCINELHNFQHSECENAIARRTEICGELTYLRARVGLPERARRAPELGEPGVNWGVIGGPSCSRALTPPGHCNRPLTPPKCAPGHGQR